jgi:outer membrane protein assembly factor BamB
VYVGGQGVTCYDTRTGERVWKRENGNRFVVGVAVLNGRVHAVERASDASASGDPKGFLSVVDAATGEHTRTVRCGARTFVPTTDGDLIVVPTRRGQIGFDSAGNRRWRVADGTPRIPPGPAAITDDSVYLSASGAFGRYSRKSDLITGTSVDSRWSVDSGLRRRWHPPTVTDECIVAPLVQLAQDLPEAGGVRPGLHAYGRDGSRRWHLPVPTAWMSSDESRGQFIRRVSSPAVADGVGYVTSTRLSLEGGTVTSTDTTLQAFDTASGDERWRATFPGEGSDAVSPVVTDDRVYAVVPGSGTREGEKSRLVAYGRRGDRLWSIDVPGLGYHLAVSGETLYIALRGGEIVAYRSR